MAKSTRFATTVTTRNLVTPQGFDGFYLDGRISGPRDSRGGDSTLDREDRGFFYALYSNNGADLKQTALRNKKHLDKIFEDVKIENRYNIDYEINELADCAVNIAGRTTLGDQQLPPYFTGIVVKDGEMAAITSGRGCAYLYRNDILYPLTKDEFPLSETDRQGNPIPNLDLYCAGLAGTIRYSNIAQLQPDDCFILTNKEVMETIGHHNMLRILEECYDQQDVACRVSDEMARQNPGATMQFMIGFVENITTLDKAGLKSLTGRMGWTQKTLGNMGGLAALNQEASPIVGSEAVTQPETTSTPAPAYTHLDNSANDAEMYAQQPVVPPVPAYPENAAYAEEMASPRGLAANERLLQGVEEEGMSTAKKVVIAIMLIIILLLAGFLGYMALKGNPFKKTKPTTSMTQPSISVPAVVTPTQPKMTGDIFPPITPRESTRAEESKPMVSQPETTTPAVSQAKPSTPSVAESKPTTAPAGSSQKYTVVDGDTLWGIAAAHVGNGDIDEYMQKIIDANKSIATADGKNIEIYPGDEINLPNP